VAVPELEAEAAGKTTLGVTVIVVAEGLLVVVGMIQIIYSSKYIYMMQRVSQLQERVIWAFYIFSLPLYTKN